MPPLPGGSSTYTRLTGRLRDCVRRSILEVITGVFLRILTRKEPGRENNVQTDALKREPFAELISG